MATVLEEAEAAVAGPRQAAYGHPRDNFDRIADLWTTYLRITISAQDVAMMMVLLKVARISRVEAAGRDSLVDIAGYARCCELIQQGES